MKQSKIKPTVALSQICLRSLTPKHSASDVGVREGEKPLPLLLPTLSVVCYHSAVEHGK